MICEGLERSKRRLCTLQLSATLDQVSPDYPFTATTYYTTELYRYDEF